MAATRWSIHEASPNQYLSNAPSQKQAIFEQTFAEMEAVDYASTQKLKDAFHKVEKRYPGFSQEFVIGLLQRLGLEKDIDISETSLRVAGFQEGGACNNSRNPYLAEIEQRTQDLKACLSTIPVAVSDRRAFIDLIKTIAGAIKQVLDAVTQALDVMPHGAQRQALDEQRRCFLIYCRQFSSTLKEYFGNNDQQAVFNRANRLVNQANLTLLVIRHFD